MSQQPFEKLKKDGKVAVLISPGFGAGWYSWNTEHVGLVFDREIAEAVLAGKTALVLETVKRKYPDVYPGGADQLRVAWVNEGDAFEIKEYDGAESLHVIGKRDYLVA